MIYIYIDHDEWDETIELYHTCMDSEDVLWSFDEMISLYTRFHSLHEYKVVAWF